jgi:nucleosome assembly protein 1-like 1
MSDRHILGESRYEVVKEEVKEHAGVGITDQLLRRPDVLAALQRHLNVELMEELPAPVRRRIKALKKIQLETTNIEAKFYEEVNLLECKYHKLCTPLFQKRAEVISGLYEPTDVECEWKPDEKEGDFSADMKNKAIIEELKSEKMEENKINKNEETKGIPNFWLTIFKNVQMLSQMVQEHDEPILKHLFDIKVILLESNRMGFVLEFHFSPNEYFSNSVLTKEYEMKCVPDKNDPFSFQGPEIYKCKGCIIDWKKGKNVTVKTTKKKQKHKSRVSVTTVTKTIQNDSFFNFFSPPPIPDEVEMEEDTRALLTSDFKIGHCIREQTVPRAILYFTKFSK